MVYLRDGHVQVAAAGCRGSSDEGHILWRKHDHVDLADQVGGAASYPVDLHLLAGEAANLLVNFALGIASDHDLHAQIAPRPLYQG